MNFLFTNVAYASVDTFIQKVNLYIVNPIIVFLFALAIAFFLFGVFQFISNAENEEKKTAGKKHMLWGTIGLTVMLGVWAILSIILNTMNISTSEINPKTGTVNLTDYNPTYPALK